MLSTSKVIGSIDREIKTFAASIDECAAKLVASNPDSGLTVCRVPDRVVLQAGTVGVSISLFRSRAGAEASAEVVRALWHGAVTVPGGPRTGHRATQIDEQQFRIVASDDDDASWLWMDERTKETLTSPALAAACVETMATQLSAG